MDSRSPKECMIRFGRINPTQNHGKWTQMEDAKLIASHQIFGPTWCRISKYVGTRNAIQCRDRFLNCLDPALNFEKFTYDDDVVLLKLHKKMGPAWAKMLPHFKGRTDNMLLSRYTTLKRWKKKAEWFESQSNETKNMLLGRSLKKEERNELMQRTEAYFKKHLNVDKADYERQQRDRENNVDPDLIPPRPPLHFKYTHRLGLDKSGSYWSQRLNFYKHLSDNLKKSLEKSMSATLKNPSSSKLHAHMAKDIMDEAVQETMQETESEPKIKPKVQKVQRVLNKIFLRECDLRVQDMVKLTQELQCKNKGRIRHLDIDEQLRSLLATKKRLRKRKGRSRHYFNKEPSCVQEADAEDLKHTVPCIMMKSLGTDVNRLYTQTRWKGLECMDSIRNQKKFENDPEYISEIAKLTEAFSDTSPMGGDGDNLAQLKKGLSEKKMKAIKQIFSEKYQEIRNDLEGALSSISCDMGLLSSLKDKHNVAEAEQYPQILFAKATTDACKSSDSETESSVADSQIGAEKLPPAVRRLACSLPISTSLKREDRRLSRSQGATTPSKLEFEKLKLMTSEEIAQEKSNMPEVKSLAVEDLPPLPPNTSTVRCLKVLLWKEKDLIKTASPLCKPVKTQENSLPTEGVSHSTSTQRNDDNMDVDSIDDCELVEHQHPYHIQPVDTADINFGTSPTTASAEPSFSSATHKLALENPPDYMPVTTISEIKVETRLLDNGSIEVLMPPYSSKTKNETKQDDSKKSIPSRTISDIKVFKVISGASLQRSQLDPQGLQSQAVHDRAAEASKNTTTSESDNLKSSPMIFKSFDKEILPLTAEGENLITKIRQQDEYKTLLARFKALFTWPTLLSTTQTSDGVGSELSTKINDYVLRMLEKKLEQKGLKQETNESSTTQKDGVAESAVSDQPDLSLSESSSAQPIKKRGRPPGTGKPRGSKLQRLDSKEPGTTDGDANAASQSAVENETVSVDKTEEKPKRRVGRPKGSKKVNKDPIVERPKRNTQPLITDETEEEQVGAGRRPQWWKEALIAAMMAKRGIELGKEQDQPVDIAEDMDFQDQGNYSDDDWAVQSKLEMTRKRRRSGRFSKGTLATKTKTN
ncbi:uncharacterized protein LOC106059356 [Biomphalaria glabrata]|uniref:Uncharacterized protein LOC106059356 n=1 Tax=Biomphalaria glabrata TaxID=6526 RepID=A0A9W3BH02_BIOGL|nr:uncharacterized protein LOC106059356 [Biomphalaria glabrata]